MCDNCKFGDRETNTKGKRHCNYPAKRIASLEFYQETQSSPPKHTPKPLIKTRLPAEKHQTATKKK
jgi:hypothetical protein